jgi:hypothetical protein
MTLSEKIAARHLKVKDSRVSTFIEPKKQEIMTAIREINIEGQFNPTDAELMYVASVFSAKKFLSLADVKAEDIDIIGRRELEDLNQKLKVFTDKMNAVKAFGLFDLIDKLSQEVNESDIGALWEKAVNAKPSLYAKFMSMFQPSYADRSISERVQNISVILKSKGASLGAKIDKIELDLRQHKREQDINIKDLEKVYQVYIDSFIELRKQFALIMFVQHFYKTQYETFLQSDLSDMISIKEKEEYAQVYDKIQNRAFIIQKSMANLPLTVAQNSSIISSCRKIIDEIDNTILSSMPMIRSSLMSIHGVLIAKQGMLASKSATELSMNLSKVNSNAVTQLSKDAIEISAKNRLKEAKNLKEVIDDFKNRQAIVEQAKLTAGRDMEEAQRLLNEASNELSELFAKNKIN